MRRHGWLRWSTETLVTGVLALAVWVILMAGIITIAAALGFVHGQ
jgi:hypothetical protein